MYSNSTCDELSPLLVRDDLASVELERVVHHLAACVACREASALLRPELHVALEPGVVVENYRVDHLLGRGGTSSVYAATNLTIRKRVAIKVLHPELVGSTDARERFTRDATLVAQLRSEHVCRLVSFGELPTPYMILEYLDGEDLLALVDRVAHVDVPTAVDYVIQACAGLAEAHARKIIHRDIKPANLFRVTRPDGSPLVKLLDFGTAKLSTAQTITRTGVNLGSVPYMAPEQLRSSRTVDVRADIWSLGATLHHLVAGTLPFPATTAADAAIRIWTDDPAPLDDPDLAAIVHRCLAKSPADRPADVAALATELAPFGPAGSHQLADRVGRILAR